MLASVRNFNPFRDRDYVQLPTSEGPGAPLPAPTRREEEEGWFVRESTQVIPIVFVNLTTLSSMKTRHPCSGTCALHF